MLTRRRFLQLSAASAGAGAFALYPARAEDAITSSSAAAPKDGADFFVIGDTHYLAQAENPSALDQTSRGYSERLIGWLNKLPNTEIPVEAGGGKVLIPRGVIHVGDMTDSGEREEGPSIPMQSTEWAAWTADYGLNGDDGKLQYPVHELHGNHDSPKGKDFVIEALKARNLSRKNITNVSKNGVHYSWDWNGIHFVNLGLVVGEKNDVARPRKYAALDSLDFLAADLAEHVGTTGRPVVISHHVDVANFSGVETNPDQLKRNSWDYEDVHAYHRVLLNYRVAAIFHGHTHSRNIFPWDGTPPQKDKAFGGKNIPVFNTSRAAHFNWESQAFLYMTISNKEVIAREFATPDGWKTAAWTPQVWRVAI